MIGITLKTLILIVGIVLAVVGIIIDNWKISAIGTTVALVSLIFA